MTTEPNDAPATQEELAKLVEMLALPCNPGSIGIIRDTEEGIYWYFSAKYVLRNADDDPEYQYYEIVPDDPDNAKVLATSRDVERLTLAGRVQHYIVDRWMTLKIEKPRTHFVLRAE